MNRFLLTGDLGELKVGTPISKAFYCLGKPESTGVGTGHWRIEAYSGRTLQISHLSGIIGLIGIYFTPNVAEPPLLPAVLQCEVPFSAFTTRDKFTAYLDLNKIHWTCDLRLPGVTNLRVGENVTANFEEGLLRSLLSSAELTEGSG